MTLAQSDGNTITVTDQGAVSGAFSFGTDALSLADRATGRSLQFAEYAQDSSNELVRDAIAESVNFADRQAGRVAEAYDLAGDHSESAFQRAFEFGRDLFGSSLNTVTGVLREGQAQLGNTVSNLNQITRQQSTSEAERVQDLASKTLYVGVGMVALFVLAMYAMRASR